MGVVPCWGNAPVVALANSEGEARNVLVVGTGEFGHVLKTCASARLRAQTADSEAVNTYVVEKHPETLARHCVLLATAMDTSVGLRERTELFLEIYGNAFLSPKGLEYVKEKSSQAARVLSGGTSEPGDAELCDALDWSLLKHKEFDEVLDVLLQWKAGTVLDMDKYWDTRLRRYYENRYDYRRNAADWDYHMKMKTLAGEIVNSREFIKWRLQGIAFEFRDTTYSVPNITMGTWVEGRRKGCSIMARGFWSDIINSPYLAFGLEADNEKLFKVRNKEQVHTACDVSEYNVSQMLHALHTGEHTKPRVVQSGMGSFGDDAPSEEELNAVNNALVVSGANPGIRMTLLLGEAKGVLDRARYEGLFDAVLVSNVAASQAATWINKILCRDGLVPTVVFETAKHALDFKPDSKTEFVRRCYEAAREAGWMLDGAAPTTGEAAGHLRFVACGENHTEKCLAIPELPALVVNDKSKAAEKAAEKAEKEAIEAPNASADTGTAEEVVAQASTVTQALDEIKAVMGVEVIVVQRNPDRITRRPRELLVKVRLPGLTSAAGVDVDVDGAARSLRVDHLGANLHAQATLPFPVDGDKGSATFNSDTSLLILTLPVVVPKEEAKDALAHLENSTPNEASTPNGDNEPSETDEMEHVMVREQGLRGMAIPSKLGASIVF